MNRSLPVEKALDDVLIAFAMNGEALRPEQGYPLRAVIPGWEGNLWVKWLRRIEVGDMPWQAREETSKYTDLLADGRSRRFTFFMDAKSVVTNPSPQAPLKHKGSNVLSGLPRRDAARSSASTSPSTAAGTGSMDRRSGSRKVADPLLRRFRLERAAAADPVPRDELTGYVQPTKEELRKIRGTNSIYHNNGIQTWHVKANGETENVEIG
ncbi:Sulfane dehydrogenase subunit SoxC OS=Bosea thiooxidans OX=53254 GN=ARD30_15235 PE=4 SV=1 [Bosea thiooxidans]